MINYEEIINKKCSDCGEIKPIEEFYLRGRNDKKEPEAYCKKCRVIRSNNYKKKPERTEAEIGYVKKVKDKISKERQLGINISKYILIDSKKSDKRKGFDNDLDREYIESLISKECSYCGETELRMTLDRIDNNKGHTKDNVVCACIRCNYLRRDMPYEAMLVLSSALKEARIKGLFGDWIGHFNRSKKEIS